MSKVFLLNTLSFFAAYSLLAGLLNAQDDFLFSQKEMRLLEQKGITQEEVQEKQRTFDAALRLKGAQEEQSLPSSPHFSLIHNWVACAADWSIFELEDGSQWYIAFEDRFRIADWNTAHPLVLRRNNYWDSNLSYKYQLYNLALHEAIQVNNLEGPYYGGFFTREISYIDFSANSVQLTDYSKWKIKGADSSKIMFWMPSQAVMLGLNNEIGFFDWLFSSYEYILINIERDDSVRADWKRN